MGQLLVRGIDAVIIDTLKQRAQRAGRSVEAEHRAILEQALVPQIENFAEAAKRIREFGPQVTTSSTDLIRADRDRDHPAFR